MADYEICMNVGYHDANNVSNVGGNPVTQLILKNVNKLFVCVCVCVSADMSPYCSAHDEWLIMKLCMYVGYRLGQNSNNVPGKNPVDIFEGKGANNFL